MSQKQVEFNFIDLHFPRFKVIAHHRKFLNKSLFLHSLAFQITRLFPQYSITKLIEDAVRYSDIKI